VPVFAKNSSILKGLNGKGHFLSLALRLIWPTCRNKNEQCNPEPSGKLLSSTQHAVKKKSRFHTFYCILCSKMKFFDPRIWIYKVFMGVYFGIEKKRSFMKILFLMLDRKKRY
jgi:hypothetical protein